MTRMTKRYAIAAVPGTLGTFIGMGPMERDGNRYPHYSDTTENDTSYVVTFETEEDARVFAERNLLLTEDEYTLFDVTTDCASRNSIHATVDEMIASGRGNYVSGVLLANLPSFNRSMV